MVESANRSDRRTYSMEEAAAIYGVSRTGWYRLARLGELPVPVIRIGRRMVISQAAVEADLNRQKEAASEDIAA